MLQFRSIATARASVKAIRSTSVPAMARAYTPDSRQEGATGSSQGFNKREQAEEGQYAKRKEAEQLHRLREALAKSQAESTKLAEQIKEHEKKQ